MSKLIIPPVLLFYFIVFSVAIYLLFPSYNWLPFPVNLSGLVVSFFGFSVMGKCRDLFKKYQTSLAIGESKHLITEGVFNRSRNPMYCGMFVLLLGFVILIGNVLSLIFPLLFVILLSIIHIPLEEQMMQKTFGDDYLTYKSKVRRWI